VTLFDREAAAVPTDRANELVQLWREAVRGGRTLDALELGGLLRAPRKAKFLLQDIAQIIRGAEKSVLEDQLLGVETKGRLCGVSLLVDDAKGENVECPLVIVAPTGSGGRILLDVELGLPTNRGKELRNGDALEGAARTLEPNEVKDLKALMEWHEKLSRPIWEKWQRDRAEERKK